ncbi:hypothetical protein XNC3_2980003 [Xenorhabdus nematophila F1]|nr:hypothetical protein XNC3_2980003 [Xenorhabdus nematophila F1]CEE95289.1 hypothetical protein XNA1_5070002 [Xenorhabdus nematophila str. Anatoliense]CEK23878.1 protein of unknown function [Xenorhabdus nematophila AN6/1]
MKYTPVGVNIAKHLMQIHFVEESTGQSVAIEIIITSIILQKIITHKS